MRASIPCSLSILPGASAFQQDMIINIPLIADLELIHQRCQVSIDKNLRSLISTDNPGAQCKKKHSHVAFNYVQGSNAAGIKAVRKQLMTYNLANPFTKSLSKSPFMGMFDRIFDKGY
jgi:hypothetical protein